MADRYLVAAGNWNDNNTWSATDGGAPGASFPVAGDNVFLTAASGAITLTVNVSSACVNFDCTGFTGTLAGTGALNVSGNFTLSSGMTRTYTGAITFSATSTGKTITLNGKATASTVTFSGAGGGWTLQDAWNNGSSSFSHTAGTLNTNGQAITCFAFSSSGTTTRTLTLGASILTMSGNWSISGSNITFNANTSTINCTVSNLSFSGGGQTYNIVNLTTTGGGSAFNINGSNTFASGTWSNSSSSSSLTATLAGDQTFTGALTISGNNATTRRFFLRSSTAGTARTITAGSVTLTNVSFMDITGAGAASWSGTSIGDAGGNSNITFTAAVTRYKVSGTGSWSSTSMWSTTSGGASGASVPLCHDTVIFDANSFSGAGQTITADMLHLGKDIDFTGVSNNPNLALSNTSGMMVFGDLTFVSGMTVAHTRELSLCGRGAHTLDTAGQGLGDSATGVITFQFGVGGSYTLLSDITLASGRINLYDGTFDADTFDVTAPQVLGNSGRAHTVNMGSGTWELTGTGNVWNSFTNFTINAETSLIRITDTSATSKTFFTTTGNVFYDLEVTGDNVTANNSSISLHNLTLNHPGATNGTKFVGGTTITLNDFFANGSVGSLIKISSTTSTNFIFSKTSGVVSCDYISLIDSTAQGGATWYAGANSTDLGGNIGWIFTAPPTLEQANFFVMF